MSQGKIVGDRYRLGKKIGEGTSGSVFVGEPCDAEGKLTPNSKKYAIKAIPLAVVQQNLDQTKREIAILKGLRHRHVVSLREVLQSANNVYLVMELVEGGTIAHLPLPLPEDTARGVLRQLFEGLQYVHAQGVAHRDLKPANVMLKRYMATGPNGEQIQTFSVKLTDFGLANVQREANQLLSTRCGTPHYVAPEIVDGRQYDGKSSDVWSCGVLLYYILTGRVPFDDQGLALAQPNFDGLWHKIRTATFDMPAHFSPPLQQFLRSMLTVDPARRATVEQCLADPWLCIGLTPQQQQQQQQPPQQQPQVGVHQPPAAAATTAGGANQIQVDDDDRRRSEQEEVVGGDPFQKVGAERTAFVASGGEGPDEFPLDALTLYQAQRYPPAPNCARFVNMYFRVRLQPCSFAQVVQLLTYRLQALGIDLRGAAQGQQQPGTQGGIGVGRASAVFTGTINPYKGKNNLCSAVTSVVLITFKVSALFGLNEQACIVQLGQGGQRNNTADQDFNTVSQSIAAALKE